MAKYKKWLGAGIGLVFGGPIGGLMGYFVGSFLDNSEMESWFKQLESGKVSRPELDFRISLLILSAAVIKADGKIKQSELDYVKKFLLQQFGEEKANESMLLFNKLNKQKISVRQVCLQIRIYMDHPSRLQLLHYLFGIAKADGHVDNLEVELIGKISRYLGIHEHDFASIRSMFYKGKDLSYEILGLDDKATDEEIKKAYRRKTLKYHPDKVAHLGDDVQKAAREKYQNVVEAYDRIKKERDLK